MPKNGSNWNCTNRCNFALTSLKNGSKRLLNLNRLVHEVVVTANFANLSDISKLDGYVIIAMINNSSGVKSSTRIMKSYSQNKNAFQ